MVFMAKARRLRVILKPAFYVLDANGQRVQIPGKTVEFMGGRFESEDSETIALMLKHDYYNVRFTAVENENEWKTQHPEYFKPAIGMVTGAVSTINVTRSPILEAGMSQIPARNVSDPVVNIEDIIDKKISEKFDALSDKLDRLLGGQESVKAAKPKKVFTCPVPGCGEVFKSGIEVGTHKKDKHISG
jgi:hypothetical protein